MNQAGPTYASHIFSKASATVTHYILTEKTQKEAEWNDEESSQLAGKLVINQGHINCSENLTLIWYYFIYALNVIDDGIGTPCFTFA